MSPKAAGKRKAAKDGEGQPPAVKTKESNEDEEEDKKRIWGMTEPILHKIYVELDVVSRVNLSMACRRLYEVEKRSPQSKSPSTWSHLAIRTTIVEMDSGVSKRLRKQPAQTKLIVDVELRNGDCKSHDGDHSECTVFRGYTSMKPFVDGEALYWKTPLAEIPTLLSSIFLSTSVNYVCAKVDLSDSTQSWFEILSQFECETLNIQHEKAETVIERKFARWLMDEEDKEPALLSATLFDASAPFFPGVKRLILKDIRLEKEDYQAFYEKAKSSSMKVEWSFTKSLNANDEFAVFASEVMGVTLYAKRGNRIVNKNLTLTTTHQINQVYYATFAYLSQGLVMVDGGCQTHLRKDHRVLITPDDLLNDGRTILRSRRLPYKAEKDK